MEIVWRLLKGNIATQGSVRREGMVRVTIQKVDTGTSVRHFAHVESMSACEQVVKLVGWRMREMYTLRPKEEIKVWIGKGQTLKRVYAGVQE